MASTKTFTPEIFTIYFILVLFPQYTEASRHDSSSLLSLLKKLHLHKQPLIIVLDQDPWSSSSKGHLNLGLSMETSDEDRTAQLVRHLLGHDKHKRKPIQHKKSTLKPFAIDGKKKYRPQRLRDEDRSLQTEDRNVLRSPIIKQLLRISNSLRCRAKDECQDKCNNKFVGKKEKKCEIQCEIKYVCEEEEEEKDDCDGGNEDSCGRSDERKGSTKGEMLVNY